eukprot:TRINITY_DN7766_c0_g1_i1.p2 TRINITY_DN7766_c0_g1~~TRINITY_DN7766_c0_g1_i1.p2  ORF type:complete len:418 (-),score=96.58 TRINITY_DN7766_c0_g1_i1:1127-2380(-)
MAENSKVTTTSPAAPPAGSASPAVMKFWHERQINDPIAGGSEVRTRRPMSAMAPSTRSLSPPHTATAPISAGPTAAQNPRTDESNPGDTDHSPGISLTQSTSSHHGLASPPTPNKSEENSKGTKPSQHQAKLFWQQLSKDQPQFKHLEEHTPVPVEVPPPAAPAPASFVRRPLNSPFLQQKVGAVKPNGEASTPDPTPAAPTPAATPAPAATPTTPPATPTAPPTATPPAPTPSAPSTPAPTATRKSPSSTLSTEVPSPSSIRSKFNQPTATTPTISRTRSTSQVQALASGGVNQADAHSASKPQQPQQTQQSQQPQPQPQPHTQPQPQTQPETQPQQPQSQPQPQQPQVQPQSPPYSVSTQSTGGIGVALGVVVAVVGIGVVVAVSLVASVAVAGCGVGVVAVAVAIVVFVVAVEV